MQLKGEVGLLIFFTNLLEAILKNAFVASTSSSLSYLANEAKMNSRVLSRNQSHVRIVTTLGASFFISYLYLSLRSSRSLNNDPMKMMVDLLAAKSI